MNSSMKGRYQHVCRILLLLAVLHSLLSVVTAWQQQPQISSRRQSIQRILKTASTGFAASFLPGTAAVAASEDDEPMIPFSVEPFSFEIPKSWKVIVKPNPNNNKKPPKDGKIFSAIDFGTGAVLTIVQEQICSRADYALNEKQCDLVASNTDNESLPKAFGSETIFSKDITKLLRRHDDRDNAVLQGSTVLDKVELINSSTTNFKAYSTTSIPTGGTYKDRMGLDRPYMINRTVQTQVKVNDDRVYSLWLSAPSDEWSKPLVGTRLLQVWASVENK